MKQRFIMSLVLSLGLTQTWAQDSLSYILDRHHEAHQQELWEGIKSLSAKGNWLSLHGSYPATFYFKKPNKYLMINQRSRFIEAWDGVESWTIAKWTKSSVVQLSAEETMINQAIFSFGSPLKQVTGLDNKGIVFFDQAPHYWIVEDQSHVLIEYFISTQTFLLTKTIFTKKTGEPLVVIREVVKYGDFQGVSFPTHIKLQTKAMVAEYVFNKITLGDPVQDKRFSKPTKK
jgi:outer membrane lipoprotein-sorting protein